MKFTWYGKENAIIESMTPSTGTLRPDKDSSKNWDNTENLYIEGDNLEVLKLLQKSYFGKVKMIYIDPPYNTGKNFIYKDNFRDNIANYKEITNQTTKANPETNGRYHTDWLNMMYPRLKLARNLLSDEGVIFISIDENEVDNLRKILDEIFGENNFITSIAWQCLDTVKNDSKYFSNNHEYILCYGKLIEKVDIQGLKKGEKQKSYYKNYDNDPRGEYLLTPLHAKSGSENSIYTYTFSNGQIWSPPKGTYPRFSEDTLKRLDEDNRIYLDKNCIKVPQKKTYLREVGERMPPTTFWDCSKFGSTRQSNSELSSIIGKGIFQNPKPVKTISTIIDLLNCNSEDIILDFFSGSSTTAHSVIKFNNENHTTMKFIMVQIPELTLEKSEAYKAGYKNICEIGKERIRRAGDKIVSENKDKEGIENLDIGFKVFKLEYNCGGENHSMMEEGIKVDIIKRPKDKPICKFKVYGELYYLVKTSNDIIVFPYKSSIKGKAIASIFNIKLCKNKDYMQLEYLYNMKLNEFNGEDFAHTQYVTSVILDNVYKNLND